MKKFLLLITISVLFSTQFVAHGQNNSAGKSFHKDYDTWKEESYPSIYATVEHDDAMNLGTEFTMEVWIRAYTFGENRKIFGKMNNQFNNGYVMGFEDLQIYSQVYNPENQEIPRGETGSIPKDSAWVHFATTYNGSGQIINYLNGEKVGEQTVFPQNGVTNNSTEPFVIGLAPWDLYAFEFTGALDEIRIWNFEKSQDEIKKEMFIELSGTEDDLVMYYNFNDDVDSVVHDSGPNQLHGHLVRSTNPAFSWAESNAPVGNLTMAQQHDIAASWYGKNHDQYTYAVTESGLSMTTNILKNEFWKYLVFGHNDAEGITNDNAPSDAPEDFKRLSREWYINQAGGVRGRFIFNLEQAAGSSEILTTAGADSLYILLSRNSTDEDYTPLYTASQVVDNIIIFNNVGLEDKYYTLGYSSEKLSDIIASIDDSKDIELKIYPNPASETLFVEISERANLKIFDLSGRIIIDTMAQMGKNKIDINSLNKGVYIIRIETENKSTTSKLIIN